MMAHHKDGSLRDSGSVSILRFWDLARLATRSRGGLTGVTLMVGIHVVLPLAIGGFIYLAWRVDSLLMFSWCSRLGVYPLVAIMRHNLYTLRCCLPGWVLYSLPDALWVYSATAFQRIVWQHHRGSWISSAWVSIPPSLAIGGELGQLAGIIPGTFDFYDLTLCLLATIGAIALTCTRRQVG